MIKHDINAIIIGDGKYFKPYKQLVLDLNVSNFVHFVGRTFDIYEYIQASDLFVLPSKKGEMFPNTILESLSVGRTFCG